MTDNEIVWSPEQQQVFKLYQQGKNIFMTGPGGSGKTALIRRIYADAVSKMRTVAVCALTGCAAQLLECNARTVHSWSGVGLGTGTFESIIKRIRVNPYKKGVWQGTDLLIIDEVSMLSLKMFDLLDDIGQLIRRSSSPFGGIQIILAGDFFQLPPIGDSSDVDSGRFCFESTRWQTYFGPQQSVKLKTVYRQTDKEYADILNQIREGVIKKRSINTLALQLHKELPAGDDVFIRPTKLFPRRDQVEQVNREEMSKLAGQETHCTMSFTTTKAASSRYSASEIDQEIENLKGRVLCGADIVLKVGAQVMCIVNADFPIWSSSSSLSSDQRGLISLYNGSQGIVTAFNGGYPIVRFYKHPDVEIIMGAHAWESDRMQGVYIHQVPLILAWAISIHKSQGATLDYAEIDIGRSVFENGQTYVALSRVRSLDGLYLSAFDYTKIQVNQKVKAFYSALTTE